MNVLVLNGSPKGNNSITIHSMKYIENNFPEDNFQILNVGQQIRRYENIEEMNSVINLINTKDLILFAYPVYSSVAPYQLHRFIEILKECMNTKAVLEKATTQITTSKHFYDFTAHKYIEQNCADVGFKTIKGFSADMNDLLTDKGRSELISFWNYVKFSYENKVYQNVNKLYKSEKYIYEASLNKTEKKDSFDTLILTNCEDDDISLKNMIKDFQNHYPYKTRIVNINDFKFSGGCIGCLNCTTNGSCIYKDGFDDFLRNTIQTADSIIYAATIKDHFIGSKFKLFNDRQFCNGHRTMSMGMPVGYILNGDYTSEYNLINIIEGRCEVGHEFFAGVASTESNDKNIIRDSIITLSKNITYALENKLLFPQNFLGIDGSKIFRDLVYMTGGLMREDYKFYKEHNFFDYPQKHFLKKMKMDCTGYLLSIPSVKKNIQGKLTEILIKPYRDVINK